MPLHPLERLLHSAQFLKSAQNIEQCPPDEGWEIAFAGRSNAGKSSAINKLCTQKTLARTSKTPGRTQLLNFFTLDDERRLVDLPGYGFATSPEERAFFPAQIRFIGAQRVYRSYIYIYECIFHTRRYLSSHLRDQ